MLLSLAVALITLHINPNVGSAPLPVFARITVSDLVRGETCLVWASEDADIGQSCWSAERNGRTVWRNTRLTHPGTYNLWVVAGKVKSNVVTVEVR